MTPHQQSAADAHADALLNAGAVWQRTSDDAQISAFAGKLKASDPRMSGASDRDFPIIVADQILAPSIPLSQCMPTTRLTEGDELTKSSKYFRVKRADYEEATGLWTVIVSPSF
jgi:hypothetical protein